MPELNLRQRPCNFTTLTSQHVVKLMALPCIVTAKDSTKKQCGILVVHCVLCGSDKPKESFSTVHGDPQIYVTHAEQQCSGVLSVRTSSCDTVRTSFMAERPMKDFLLCESNYCSQFGLTLLLYLHLFSSSLIIIPMSHLSKSSLIGSPFGPHWLAFLMLVPFLRSSPLFWFPLCSFFFW